MKNLILFFLIFTSFTLKLLSQNPFTDSRDGTTYTTVAIGSQIWMAENLKYLPDVVGPGTFSNTTPYYYVYGYDGTDVVSAKASANYSTYGVLYNWAAAMDGSLSSDLIPSGVKGVCPEGWHLPSDFEWLYLTFYLIGDSVAGGKMKEAGTLHWDIPNTGATNESGFTALPGGFCSNEGAFYDLRRNSIWWSTTEFNSTRAYYRNILYSSALLGRYNVLKTNGLSVRCMKNSENSINESEKNWKILVYPNPTSDWVTIYSPQIENAQLQILDLNGKCLLSKILFTFENKIDIGFLNKGIYVIHIMENNRSFLSKLVILN